MINLVLDDDGVEILVFLLLLFPLSVGEFYVNSFMSPDHTSAVWKRDTCFFSENRFLGSVYDFGIDHDGSSEKFIFFGFLFSLAGGDDSDIFSHLWSGQSYAFVFVHRYQELVAEF